jgi:hypothetical protein
MRKYNRFAEYMWATFGVITLVLAGEAIYSDGWETGRLFLLAPIVAFMMFFFRRLIRKKFEGSAANNASAASGKKEKPSRDNGKKNARQ